MSHVTAEFLDLLVSEAAANPRRRRHHNLHASPDEPCQRLLNAVWPDSYIRPHRHAESRTPECLLALRGTFALIEFDDAGGIAGVHRFGRDAGIAVVEIPPNRWHTVLAMTEGAVLFETKSGPFREPRAKVFADWAPAEGSHAQAAYLERLRLSIGD